ncbi:uncharacterized protein LOC123534550 [Mercenaria mercenaria]|uniref:uncharacterized protein LOC123534550 n=1 Tax=Mercenaria mercenaria TaxID=6596 RepID=UPI00234EAB52|nr:uncharacterized protein LOC123534550 [Mercenaria mercenaria]
MEEIQKHRVERDKKYSRRVEKKPDDTDMLAKNTATPYSKTLSMNKNKINAAITTANQQAKRQFVSKRNEDLKSKQADSHKVNRNTNTRIEASERKKGGSVFSGNKNIKVDTASAGQGQLKRQGRNNKHKTESTVTGNTMKPVDTK